MGNDKEFPESLQEEKWRIFGEGRRRFAEE